MTAYPESVSNLIDEFARLPGIGRRSAERLAFFVLKSSSDEALGLARSIARVKESVRHCSVCWNLADVDPCPICSDPKRDASVVLVVEQPRDLISLEQTGMHAGVYHVLLGRLDPLDGVGPDGLTVDDLIARLREPERNARSVPVREVVLGLNPDMEGDTTSLHVAEEARRLGISTTRLARGLPSGSQIEYASRAVLADAITERRPID
ncbi:MAG: recombination protein RecR [Phycisphaerae bacterium]|nr:recombination protein RecR [Phycisphaerae bacterium]